MLTVTRAGSDLSMATFVNNDVSPGAVVQASDHNEQGSRIAAVVNGGIENANIATNAGISGTKLANTSVSNAKLSDNSIVPEDKLASDSGWREVTDAWSYDSPTTITVPSDATTKYSIGDKIKLTQTTVKYFYVVGVASTTLTITGGTDYTLVNAAISDVSYSKVATPLDFPQWLNYTPTWTNLTTGNGTLNYARFVMNGKRVLLRVKFTLGSTSSVGGSVSVSLPVTAHADYASATDTPLYAGQLNDATGNRNFPWVRMSSTTAANIGYMNSGVFGVISSTAPFTWTTSDQVMVTLEYEAA